MLLPPEHPQRTAEEHLVLGVDGGHAGVGGLGRAVAEARLFLFVVRISLPHLHDGEGRPRLVQQRQTLALDRARQLRGRGQRDRQRPGEAARQVHVAHYCRVGRAVHESAMGAKGADRDHLEVGQGPDAKGKLCKALGLLCQCTGLVSAGEAVHEFAAVGWDQAFHVVTSSRRTGAKPV